MLIATLSFVHVATDECGNSSEATQYINIVDTTAPVFVGIVEIDVHDDYAGILLTIRQLF
ncbi:MAG: hypothetical protein R2809_09395 [Flavobacteriales bacterium]